MAKTCTVAVNGQTFKAKAGDVLLDAALVSGVNISHDCRSGVCGSASPSRSRFHHPGGDSRSRHGARLPGPYPVRLHIELEEVPRFGLRMPMSERFGAWRATLWK